MDDFTNLENLEGYFKKVNCYGTVNYCFQAQKDLSLLPTLFGAVGGLVEAAHSVKTKKVMGYLVNQMEEGICLIPIVSDTLTKNKVDIENYLMLKKEKIEKVIIKSEDIVFWRIKIIMKDKKKYSMRTVKKLKQAPYHENNLNRFIKMYE